MRLVGFLGMAAAGIAAGCSSENNLLGEAPPPDAVPNAAIPPATTRTDRYEQVEKPKVDILWVVDNSGSMDKEQKDLGTNFPIFMDYFLNSNLDYHIGVVSTDMDNPAQSGKLIEAQGLRFIDTETPNPAQTFEAMSLLGTGGSPTEKGIEAAYTALELKTEINTGFLRDDSAVHVVVVSDESDYSTSNPISKPEFVEYLNNLRAEDENVSFNSIVAPRSNLCNSVTTTGADYIDVTEAVGGVFWSLCDDDWVGALEAIGLETAGLKREYFLSAKPVEDTVEVSVIDIDGVEVEFFLYDPTADTGDYTYSEPRNSVTFLQYVPAPGAVVQIHYEVLAASERVE